MKGQTVAISGFASHMAFTAATQLCGCSRKAAIDAIWTNRGDCIPIKLDLQNRKWHLICQPSLWRISISTWTQETPPPSDFTQGLTNTMCFYRDDLKEKWDETKSDNTWNWYNCPDQRKPLSCIQRKLTHPERTHSRVFAWFWTCAFYFIVLRNMRLCTHPIAHSIQFSYFCLFHSGSKPNTFVYTELI